MQISVKMTQKTKQNTGIVGNNGSILVSSICGVWSYSGVTERVTRTVWVVCGNWTYNQDEKQQLMKKILVFDERVRIYRLHVVCKISILF